ncbi:hypothetical protein [Bradyrhizobium sp. Gha]|uniref:hypothetical protein n=1 Tax=Bradyrhizobium sp. Gha TaxID=1855318 RepID=UPI0008ED8AE6|nr:hypothetical protein [Bradyrhizobium sp. Gha]SFI62349.1 hypothetical protein SAMN05216525_11183 [Bradyrhizobium sp. Gha]
MELNGAASLAAIENGSGATVTVMARGNTVTIFTGRVSKVSCDYIGRTINVLGHDHSAALHENCYSFFIAPDTPSRSWERTSWVTMREATND